MDENAHIAALRKNGYKITPQRLAVIEYIKESPGHFTAEEVYRNIKQKEPTITLATVYNIFRAMKKSGIVKSFEANGSTIYETNNRRHANFLCSSCGKIEDIEIADIPELTVFSNAGNVIDSVEIVIRGVCASCRRKKNA